MTVQFLLRVAATVSLCLVAACAWAQPTLNADLSLALHVTPSASLAPGTTGLLTLTFTNNGPDSLPAVGAGSTDYPHLDFARFSLVASAPSPCTMYYDDLPAPPGMPSSLVATVFAGPVAAGESKSCTVSVHVEPSASGTYLLEFYATDGQVFIDDPNTVNNRDQVLLEFGIPRAAISVPFVTPIGLLAMVLGFLVVAGKRLG